MAMVASVGKNDKKEMYDYLGGTQNSKRSDELDSAFKAEKSNLSIVIVECVRVVCKTEIQIIFKGGKETTVTVEK